MGWRCFTHEVGVGDSFSNLLPLVPLNPLENFLQFDLSSFHPEKMKLREPRHGLFDRMKFKPNS